MASEAEQRPGREVSLEEVLGLLVIELKEAREQRHRETQRDLRGMEERIIEAILSSRLSREDERLLEALDRRAERLTRKLEALDELTPPISVIQ